MMKAEHFLFIFGLLLVSNLKLANAVRDTDICHIFSNNTIIRDPDSCSKYITCINFVSHYKECTGATPFFDKNTQKCVKTLDEDSVCYTSCNGQVDRFIADPKSCYGYFYCRPDGNMDYGLCPEQTHFNEARQTCAQVYDSDCTADDFDYCSVIKNGVNFNDERRCDAYFTCTKGILVNTKCKDKYFNAITGTCITKSQVSCSEHPVPKDVCGTDKKPKNNVYVADSATCNGYFYCSAQEDGTADLHPRWGTCPVDYFFDAKSGTCKDPLLVKCAYDRCEGRSLTFVTSGTAGCRNYLRCMDGITYDEKTCGNLFFDENRGSCVSSIVKLAACS